MINRCVICFGSNIEPEANIIKALALLSEQVHIIRTSRFIQTEPIGITDQPDFINGAVLIETSLTADYLKSFLKQVEDQCDRDRTAPKYGSRTMDLDIVIWNDTVVDDDYYTRPFLKDAVSEVLGD